jgi:hypothetical protein
VSAPAGETWLGGPVGIKPLFGSKPRKRIESCCKAWFGSIGLDVLWRCKTSRELSRANASREADLGHANLLDEQKVMRG